MTTPHSSSSFRSGTYLSCARQKCARTPDSCSVQQHTMSKAQRELATLFPWSGRPEQSLLVLAPTCHDLTSLQVKNAKGDIFSPGCDVGNLRVNRSHPNLYLGRLRAVVPSYQAASNITDIHGALSSSPANSMILVAMAAKSSSSRRPKRGLFMWLECHASGLIVLSFHILSPSLDSQLDSQDISRLAPDYFNQFNGPSQR